MNKETSTFTKLQRKLLFDLLCRPADSWYRARGSGQRVTLASLYYRGFLIRRAWRTGKQEADNAYEYRPAPIIEKEWRKVVVKGN